MIEFDKILFLENDIRHIGLPDVLKDCAEIENVPYDTIFSFSQEMNSNPNQVADTITSLNENLLVVAYPSFVGYGNSFEGKLSVLSFFMSKGIKLNLAIVFGDDFYLYLVNWINNLDKKNRVFYILMLESILKYHTVYYVTFYSIYGDGLKINDTAKKLNYDDVIKYHFPRRSKFKVLATGEELITDYVSIDKNDFEKCHVLSYYESDEDNGRGKLWKEKKYKLSEIEKI